MRVREFKVGSVDMEGIVDDPDQWLGVLVLRGFLLARLSVGRGMIGWLIGPDDLLRPWEISQVALARPVSWRALTPLRLALLDQGFSRRAAGTPALARTLLARAAGTTHWLLATSLVASPPTIRERLMLLFSQLGERWGRATPDGVLIDMPLTHSVIANLCGARRPTVTGTLKSLRADGLLTRSPNGGWLLQRELNPSSDGRDARFSDHSEILSTALGHTSPSASA